MYKKFIKRPLDIVISLLALIVLSPVLIIVAILIRIKLGSPVIFKQKRPGLNEKIFILYKFRTMTDKRNNSGDLLPDSERLTNFGRFLRSTSIDELPELFNIIKGEMSLVGPRPLLVQYLPLYNEQQKRRHEVRPGLTGLAQVNGRNAISWEEKFTLDVEYISNLTFINDLIIIMDTIKKVLIKEGISAAGEDTMPEFIGYKEVNNALSEVAAIEDLN